VAVDANTITEITQLYVALFGRAPDAEGLGFWAAQRQAGRSLEELVRTMYATDPARAYYPANAGHPQVIWSFYLNVLGRQADAGGLVYWINELDQRGADVGTVLRKMIGNVAGYDGSDPDGQRSSALFNKRVELAVDYTAKGGGVDGAQQVVRGITLDDVNPLPPAPTPLPTPAPTPAPGPGGGAGNIPPIGDGGSPPAPRARAGARHPRLPARRYWQFRDGDAGADEYPDRSRAGRRHAHAAVHVVGTAAPGVH
jgi:hypothetical protein